MIKHPTGFIEVVGSISSMDLTTVFHFSPCCQQTKHILSSLHFMYGNLRPCSLFYWAENGVLGNALKDGMIL